LEGLGFGSATKLGEISIKGQRFKVAKNNTYLYAFQISDI
jgi:hypothetical protein